MESPVREFEKLIKSAQKILITSHIPPDPDAVSSVLLLGRTLKENFPDKAVRMVLEEKPAKDLSFLTGYEQITFKPLIEVIKLIKPDLLIVLDGNSFERTSRRDGTAIRNQITQMLTKTAIVDHHEIGGRDHAYADVFINNKRPATAEEVYCLCFDELKLKKPPDYAETALLGIISDTQRHRFDHPGYRETYRIVSQLLDDGASIEKLEVRLEHYTKPELEVIAELATNITDGGLGYTYSLIGDKFTRKWLAANKDPQDIKTACDEFVNHYLRNFEANNWGFVVYPEIINGVGQYGVTFRSASNAQDVSKIAVVLGGGGHKPAAGAKFKAKNADEAIEKVKRIINSEIRWSRRRESNP